jgi:serine/threonine protein kinase
MRPLTSSAERDSASNGSDPSPQSRRSGKVAGDDWHLVELLATGGSAEVWRAVDPTGGSAVLKIPRAEWRHRAEAAALLRREYELLTALAHPYVVRPLGLVTHGTTPALALEFLPGGDLVPLLGSHPRHWLGALRCVLAALAHMHARGFAHRDLKARNVLFAADSTPRLIDFASARPLDAPAAAAAGTTAAHMPADLSGRGREADQFALAVCLYELLAGRLPFGARGAQRRGEEPPPWPAPDAPAERLMAIAAGTLGAGGFVPGGLSAFADVIESAIAAYS